MAAALPAFVRLRRVTAAATRCWLGGGGFQGADGLGVHVIEVDFFDEADRQLIVDEEDLIAGIDAGAQVLPHPPITQVSEHREARIRIGNSQSVWSQYFRPDDIVTIKRRP